MADGNPLNPNQPPTGMPPMPPVPQPVVPAQPAAQQVPQMAQPAAVAQPAAPQAPVQVAPPMQQPAPAQPVIQIQITPPQAEVKAAPQQAPPMQVQAAQVQPAPMQPQTPAQTPAQPMRPGMPPVPQQPMRPGQPGVRPGAPIGARKPPNPKKLIFGCIGCFGAAILFFVIFVLIFVSQTDASGQNPLAKSLGVDTGSFVNTLILLVNLLFGALSVILFLLTIIGLFRLLMARKDDKEAKKRGLTQAGVAGLLLLLFVGIWVGIYLFLSSKQVRTSKTTIVAGIITEPAETLNLTAPITIKFDGTKVPIDARKYDILTYLWNFGDGETSTVSTASHTYKDKGASNGRFDVTLDVTKREKTNLAETTDRFTKTITIANVQLGAIFIATPQSGPAPLDVSFDASASVAPAGEIVSYDWDFDNNNIFTDATGVTATHTFPQIGTYKVNLRVVDNTGQNAVTSQDIEVTAPNEPVGIIEIPSSSGKYFVGTQYSFQGDKSVSPNGAIEKYEWNFGDGSQMANTRTAVHIYKTAGTYEVTLNVTDESGKSGSASQQIKVEIQESSPIAIIKTVPPPAKEEDDFISGINPFEVSFDASGSSDPDNNIVDYKWDFDGDGTDDAAGAKASYVYKVQGSYNATVTVIDAENNTSKATLVVVVGAQPLQARLTANPFEGVIPLTVTFDAGASSYPSGQIVSYEWDFGDGSAKRIDAAQVTYKYTKIGTFTATVTAIASDNTRSTAATPINIRPVTLTACFTPSAESGAAPITVEFDPYCSTGTVAKWSWDFGDGQTSKTRKPTHTYDKPGSYQVTLEVADNQNVIDTFSKNILVTGTI
jgi:PKD repeat protein